MAVQLPVRSIRAGQHATLAIHPIAVQRDAGQGLLWARPMREPHSASMPNLAARDMCSQPMGACENGKLRSGHGASPVEERLWADVDPGAVPLKYSGCSWRPAVVPRHVDHHEATSDGLQRVDEAQAVEQASTSPSRNDQQKEVRSISASTEVVQDLSMICKDFEGSRSKRHVATRESPTAAEAYRIHEGGSLLNSVTDTIIDIAPVPARGSGGLSAAFRGSMLERGSSFAASSAARAMASPANSRKVATICFSNSALHSLCQPASCWQHCC